MNLLIEAFTTTLANNRKKCWIKLFNTKCKQHLNITTDFFSLHWLYWYRLLNLFLNPKKELKNSLWKLKINGV